MSSMNNSLHCLPSFSTEASEINKKENQESMQLFPHVTDFSKITIQNWFYEEPLEDLCCKLENKIVTENQEIKPFHDNIKDSSEVNQIEEIKDGCHSEIENTPDDLRKEVRTKSVLRCIRRDIKKDFYVFTLFDIKRKENKTKFFVQCLNRYSAHFYGSNPSFMQKLVLGSLIFDKYMQLSLRAQLADGEINNQELHNSLVISNLVSSVPYKYSDGRLTRLALIPEFKEIIAKHASEWGDKGMSLVEKEFYSKILMLCLDE